MRNPIPSNDFYQHNPRLKWIVLAVSFLISVSSIYYTNVLVDQLKARERQQVQLFARAIEYTLNESLNSNILFVSEEIIYKNNSVPTILVDENDKVIQYRNIDIDSTRSASPIEQQLSVELQSMADTYDPIIITLKDPNTDEVFGIQKVYYRNSFLLTQLIAYPYVQLTVIAIFGFISYLAFNYSKAAEQNRVWVGLAKETAHQLGTPLSSLMAWIEVIREDPYMRQKGVADELEKDIQKLKIVTERFSSIGSIPTLRKENIVTLINNVVTYLRPRISSKIKIEVFTLSDHISALVHAPLFEWVIENLCKNAVDAMGSSGTIAIKILRGNEGKVFIDVSDTGKGIPRSKLGMVFKAGFTTKKRGWGLGLTLAKRIIETYHNGKIFVKSSDETMGTTFRISLNAVTPTNP
ncbi:MAG TPA: HAMP domain-containing sensor histidine kinase [Chryseosolibacter sp.]|nr:HAMP domain-containing sensor histidine kinase [Chryseosolibacter sp.]